tara:strand:- start:2437 stop:3021 length:585 start_codon:yes stop_codon:yes gene_type:complete
MGALTDIFPASSTSNVLEIVQGTCDGRAITVDSGTYTLENVTTHTNSTTSYQKIPGSLIAYTPPATARSVLYRFDFKWHSIGSSGISHFYVDVDGTLITNSRNTFSENYSGNHAHMHGGRSDSLYWVFDLTASSDNAANGEFTSWTSNKTIQVKFRRYSSTYGVAANWNRYYNGTGSSGNYTYNRPKLTIIALK